MSSFLQTTEWLEFQKSVGHKTWRFDNGKIKANIVKLGLPMGKSLIYVPHGPEVDMANIQGGIKNELSGFINYLKELAEAEGSIFIKIEPATDVVAELMYVKGVRPSSKQIQPYKTVILDLGLSEEHLLGKMHTKTRYNIKVAEKHGITVRQGNDIEEFWRLLKKTTERDKFASHPREYYRKLMSLRGNDLGTKLFISYHEDVPVAGAIVLEHAGTGYYLHGASNHEYRAMMAPYALHWQIIRSLKGSGVKFYDFWGIDASRWPGVTRFKLGWGGDTKEHPGSFDIPVSGFWYILYGIARKIF